MNGLDADRLPHKYSLPIADDPTPMNRSDVADAVRSCFGDTKTLIERMTLCVEKRSGSGWATAFWDVDSESVGTRLSPAMARHLSM